MLSRSFCDQPCVILHHTFNSLWSGWLLNPLHTSLALALYMYILKAWKKAPHLKNRTAKIKYIWVESIIKFINDNHTSLAKINVWLRYIKDWSHYSNNLAPVEFQMAINMKMDCQNQSESYFLLRRFTWAGNLHGQQVLACRMLGTPVTWTLLSRHCSMCLHLLTGWYQKQYTLTSVINKVTLTS